MGASIYDRGSLTLNDSVLTVSNTAFSNNHILGEGYGVAVAAGAPTYLNNVTITNHYVGLRTWGGNFSVRDALIAGNHGQDCLYTVVSSGYNLIGAKPTGCTFEAITGDKVGTPDIPINPKLGALANNGGPTLTHSLLACTPTCTTTPTKILLPGSYQRRVERL